MKAAQIKEYGGPEIITINEVAKPTAKEGQVLVEVHAAAINPFDWKLREGYMKERIPLQLPITVGADFSGVITELGPNVTDYKPGDEVYGSATILNGGSGATAEYAAANTANIALKPKNLSHNEAAALVLVGVSAVQVLENHIQLKSGQKILVHGGAGGIGSVAIQYAKYLGGYVATTATEADKDFVTGLGADEVIDYEKEKFEEKLSGYDAVFDTVAGEVYQKSFQVLKTGGVIVSMNEQPNEELAAHYGVRAVLQSSKTDPDSLKHLAELADNAVIKAQVDKAFPLQQASEAYKHAEEGHPKGKVVIEVKQ